ncbi:MAG: translocation protein TolB, partial [Cyclobacteriaceae bacterium]
MSRLYSILISFWLILPITSHAQQALEPFGKNRIQYKNFEWRYYSSENFDVYFYDGGQWLARLATDYLEEEFNRVTDILGYAPYFKTKIFLYNSNLDLQQSNVGVDDNNFARGGQTEFIKSHVEIAYPGTVIEFKEELLLKISQMLINEMMFGGSLADMFQNQYLLNLPDWFMDGAAAYIAKGYDVTLDDFARDFFNNDNIGKLNKYSGEEASLVGQSIWNFVAENYGKSNISNILNLTRIIRNEERSISNTLGLPFRQFIAEWYTYYQNMIPEVKENYHKPEESNEIKDTNKRDVKVIKLALSPDGKYLAYTLNNQGRFKVEIKNTVTKKTKVAVRGGYKVINQEVDDEMPLVEWADDNNLVIITSQNGAYFLYTYNAVTNDLLKKELGRLSNIKSFDISDGGSLAVLSADVDGKNDLFLISLRRNSIKRLTNDIFDDTYPHFVPESSSIIFSSNRTTDSLQTEVNDLNKISDNFNLFVYNIDTTRQVLTRITNTISKDIYPIPINKNEVLYLSDQKGIYNLYKFQLRNNLYNQVTNYTYSIKDYDLSKNAKSLAFIMIDDSQNQVYLDEDFNINNNIFTPQTRRQQIINAKIVTSRLRERQLARQDSLRKATVEDSLANLQAREKSPLERMIENSDDLVDTDNYTFDQDILKERKPEESFLSAYRRSRRESKISGPLDYETRFTWSNLTTSFVIDPLIGFGIQLETQMTDLLENHKFNGGIFATTDLRSGNIFAEYKYLKGR